MKKDNRVFFLRELLIRKMKGLHYYTLSQGEVAEYYSQLVNVDNFQERYTEK